MNSKRVSEYKIQLDIEQSDATRRTIDDIDKALKSISDNAKDGLGGGLDKATESANALVKQMKDLALSGKDSTKELAAFDKAASKSIADLEKQSTQLTYSLSEQGKLQRQRLADAQKELAALEKTKANKERRKQLETEIKQIQKTVIVGTDAELKAAYNKNRALRATLKISQQENKILQVQAKSNKSMSTYLKADLKALKERLKEQFKFISALKTTEGRYKAIKKATATLGKATLKGAGIIGGGLIGGAMAITGAAIGQSNNIVEREKEANRIKASLSPEEKQNLLGEMYIKTGADYTTIVDAINRVTSVLGTKDADSIAQAAVTEIKYPGAVALFRQQNTGTVRANDFNAYANRIKAVQSATGASVDQVTASTDKIANMRQKYFSSASQTDLQAIYLALQNSGAYDTQEELDRVFRGFVSRQAKSKQNPFDFAQSYFSDKATATRGVYGGSNRQQALTALSNLDWGNVSRTVRDRDYTTPTQTAAEATAEKMRRFEEKKNEMLMKVLEAIMPVVEALNPDELTAFFSSMVELAKKLAPVIAKLVTFITSTMTKLIQSVTTMYEGLKNSTLGKMMLGLEEEKDWFDEHKQHVSGQAESNGGIITTPSIAGERGMEMVVPMDYSRFARGSQLTQNLNQYFNMAGNETTTMSLAQAVKSRSFGMAMANNAYLSGRLGR